MSKHKPLLESSTLHYFSSDEELRNHPDFTESIIDRFEFSWGWLLLLLLLLVRQFCLLVVIRLTHEYFLLLVVSIFFILTVASQVLGLSYRSTPSSFCLLFIVSIFDTASFILLVYASGTLTPLGLAVMMQMPVVFKLVMLLIFEKQVFKLTHNIAAGILACCAVLVFVLFWNSYMLSLLVGIACMSVSFLIKNCYVRTYLTNMNHMNKYVLTCSFCLSSLVCIINIYNHQPLQYLQTGAYCIFANECNHSVLFFAGFVVSALLFYFAQWYYKRDGKVHAQVSILNALVTMLGFSLAGLYTEQYQISVVEIVLSGIACICCFVYYFYPEIPIGISMAEDHN